MGQLKISVFVLLACLVITPGAIYCSAYCSYQFYNTYNAQCVNEASTGCTICDAMLFIRDPPTGGSGACVPHKFFNQYLDFVMTTAYGGVFTGSYSSSNYNGQPTMYFPYSSGYATGLVNIGPHYAVRLRFFTYRNYYDLTRYNFQYGIDETLWAYTQPSGLYNSSGDIVTSTNMSHQNTQLSINFYLFSTSLPCCYYLEVKEIMLFVSRCQDGCGICSAQYICGNCTTMSNGLQGYLNPADHLCYSTCPQSTYPTVQYFLDPTAIASLPEYVCTTCNPLCLECTTAIFCTKCYTLARNQSFLLNNMCYQVCPLGYLPQQSDHTCVCPAVSYFNLIVAGVSTLCSPCAVQCNTCIGTTNLLCSTCSNGYYLAYGTTHCQMFCPQGQYIFHGTLVCHLCDPSCSTCATLSTTCTGCFFTNKVAYLLNNVCVPICPAGYAMNNITFSCDPCVPYTYSYLGVCQSKCPTLYFPDYFNASCIPLSQTNYNLSMSLSSIKLLPNGKTLEYQLIMSDNISSFSLASLLKNIYTMGSIIVNDFPSSSLASPVTITRVLMAVSLPVQSINVLNGTIYLYTGLPPSLTSTMQFSVDFGGIPLLSSNNITYLAVSTVFKVSSNAKLVQQYMMYSLKSYNNLFMIPILCVVLLALFIRAQGSYELLMEYLRYIQLNGLLVFSIFPVSADLFYFEIGCNYSNLDFLPNLYTMFTNPDVASNFTSYTILSPDMDFLRLMGSILMFAFLWGFLLAAAKWLFKASENNLEWMARFGCDLMEVKILHSFWSSLLFVIVNDNSNTFSIYLTHALSYFLLALIVGKRVLIYRRSRSVSVLFLWRVISTLLIALLSFSQLLICMIIFIVAFLTVVGVFYLQQQSLRDFTLRLFSSGTYDEEEVIDQEHEVDQHIKYSYIPKVRGVVIGLLPMCTGFAIGVTVLLKEYSGVVYGLIVFVALMLIACLALIVMMQKFLSEKRVFVINQKLSEVRINVDKFDKIDTTEAPDKSIPIQPIRRREATRAEEDDDEAVNDKFRAKDKKGKIYTNPLMKVVD